MAQYIDIIVYVLTIVLGLVATYYRYNTKLQNFVVQKIAQAEKEIKGFKVGHERFNFVVDATYDWLPSWAKVIFTKEVIGKIVQYLFESISSYAMAKIDEAVNSLIEETSGDGM